MNKSFLNQNVSDSIIGNYILSCLIIIGLYVLFSLPVMLFGEIAVISLICLAICVWVLIAFLLHSRFAIPLSRSLGWVSIILLFVGPPIAFNRYMYQVDGGSGFAGLAIGIGVILFAFGWLGAVIGAWVVVGRNRKIQ